MCTSPFPSPLSFYSLLFNVATLPEFFATFVTLTAACAREVIGVPFFYSPSFHFLLHFPPFLSVACLFLLLSFLFFPVSCLFCTHFHFFHFVSSFPPLNFIASFSFLSSLLSLLVFLFSISVSSLLFRFPFSKVTFYIRTFFFILLCTCTSLAPPLFFCGGYFSVWLATFLRFFCHSMQQRGSLSFYCLLIPLIYISGV